MSDQPNSSSKAVCPEHHAALPEKPFISQGEVHFAAHQVGWIVCGFFTIISVGVSAWLINKHLRNYTNKGQQRYIVRCLFLVPIYSIISTLSYILYDSYASPLIIIRDCYEGVVLHAFFCLLLEYISHDEEEQKEAFREIRLKKWMFPLGFIRKKPSGLYFLQIMKWGVLQYAVLRPACTLASLILNYIGWYCEASWSPIWGHIYLVTIISISVTVAMYCLLQLYMPISDLLKPYNPILKFLSVKAVVFLTFWQGTFLAVLASFGVVKDTPYMTAEEINIGFGALLETFEMVIFAFLHLKAFTYLPYKPKPNEQPDFKPTSRLRSLGHVFDFRDMFRQIWKGCVYMWHRMRGYEPDSNERYSHFQRALGQRRLRGSGDKGGQDFDRLALDDPYDRKIPPQRDHPWLKLDSPTSPPSNSNHDGLEEDINSELRRLRAVSEYNQRQKQLREERRERRKRKSGSSGHRRGAAAVEKYEHLPTGGEDIFTRMDEPEDEQTFPKRVDGYRAAPGKPSFWRGWYDRVSQGGNGGGHSAVPQADEDFFEHRDRSPPTRLVRKRDDLHPPIHIDAPRETGMVVLSRPHRPTSPPPPSPPPKDPHLLSPDGPQRPGSGAPARADSFMRRVFTADVASSDGHSGSRSSRNTSQELLGPLSAPWAPDPIAEGSESSSAPVGQVAMKDVAGRYPQSPPRRDSLVLPPLSTNVASVPVKFPSPKQSQQGSVYGGSSAEGPVSSSSSAARSRAHSQPIPPPQSYAMPRGPPRPAGIVLPTPLSPARYPGMPSPTSPSNPSPQRLPTETRAIVGSGSRYPVFIPSPPPMRRASLAGEGTSERRVRPRASSQDRVPGSSRPGRRSSIDGYPRGDHPPRQMAPAPSNPPPSQRLPNAYQTVEFPMPGAHPQSVSREPRAAWPQGGATAGPSGLAQTRTSHNLPRPPPGAQIPRSPHAMTRDPVESFSPMMNGPWR